MDELTTRIQKQISLKKFCTVFQTDLEKYWKFEARVNAAVKKEIEKFASENGWSAKILDAGIRVTFRNKKE